MGKKAPDAQSVFQGMADLGFDIHGIDARNIEKLLKDARVRSVNWKALLVDVDLTVKKSLPPTAVQTSSNDAAGSSAVVRKAESTGIGHGGANSSTPSSCCVLS